MKTYENVQGFMSAVNDSTANVEDELIISDIEGKAEFILVSIDEKGIILARKYVLEEKKPMKKGSFDLKDWIKTEYKESLPKELKALNPNVRLFKEIEVYGSNRRGIKEEGSQIEYFKDKDNRIFSSASSHTKTRFYWLDTLCKKKDTYVYINGAGVSCDAPVKKIGVLPAIEICRSQIQEAVRPNTANVNWLEVLEAANPREKMRRADKDKLEKTWDLFNSGLDAISKVLPLMDKMNNYPINDLKQMAEKLAELLEIVNRTYEEKTGGKEIKMTTEAKDALESLEEYIKNEPWQRRPKKT